MSVREIRGVASDTHGDPIVGALVECALNTDAATDEWQVLPCLQSTTTDDAGGYTFELEANTDLTPTGSSYIIRITSGDTVSCFQVVVTDDAYPDSQTWFDVADILVALPPIVGQFVQGPAGPTGPTGPSGANPFHFAQNTPEAVWTVTHSLGRIPAAVRVIDSAGSEVEGDVLDVDLNTIQLTFAGAFSGDAYVF